MTFRGIHDTPITAIQIAHEIDSIIVTNDLCVVAIVGVIEVVADGMIITTEIASDTATGTTTYLCAQDAAARAARVDLTNGETCGHIVLPAIL